MPRAVIVQIILNSQEASRLTVNRLYADFLGRDPDEVGRPPAESALQAGASAEQLLAVILSSPEYFSLE